MLFLYICTTEVDLCNRNLNASKIFVKPLSQHNAHLVFFFLLLTFDLYFNYFNPQNKFVYWSFNSHISSTRCQKENHLSQFINTERSTFHVERSIGNQAHFSLSHSENNVNKILRYTIFTVVTSIPIKEISILCQKRVMQGKW